MCATLDACHVIAELGMRTAIVTGGGGALGKAICEDLSSEDWNIIIVDRVEQYAIETQRSIKGRSAILIADVAHLDAAPRAIEFALHNFGRLDALVNCAGGAYALGVPQGPFLDSNPDHWQRFIEVNLYATFSFCRAAARHMVEAEHGGIVNIASGAGIAGGPPNSRQLGAAVYSGTKAGVIGLTQALAQELGPFGIRVNAVAPGRNESRDKPLARMLELLKEEELRDPGSGRLSPLARYGRPSDIAAAVSFLLSDRSEYITGACLDLTGGIRLH